MGSLYIIFLTGIYLEIVYLASVVFYERLED